MGLKVSDGVNREVRYLARREFGRVWAMAVNCGPSRCNDRDSITFKSLGARISGKQIPNSFSRGGTVPLGTLTISSELSKHSGKCSAECVCDDK